LNLQNLHELKNAEERLNQCEKCLEKCYGPGLHRLTSIKSESANKHIPIFVRLNLLKAILNFHKGKKRECKQFLDIANNELQKVIVDDDKVTQVMTMGFTATEARLALRASFNNVDSAIEQIFQVIFIKI
jgi:exonuclease VII small subunit